MKRIAKWLTAGAMAVGLLLTPADAGFSDTQGHWAEWAINKWSQEYSIIQGYEDGTFRPDNSITRGAFAGILDRFMKFQEISSPDTFSDIEGNYWEDAILKLNAAGVYLGNDGKALPGDSITRQQAVTMIARAFRIDSSIPSWPYADAENIASYAMPAVAEMTIQGWLNDSMDGNFRPTDPITRAEIVNILGNMIQVLCQSNAVYEEDVYGTLMISSTEGVELSHMVVMGDLILAPGVQGDVILREVDVEGSIRNFSSVEPKRVYDPEEQPDPEKPAIRPDQVYVPGTTTGETIMYDGKRIPIYKGRERSRLYEGDFYWEGDRLNYVGSEFDTRFGIDVSAHQNRATPGHTIDWDAARNDGVEFAMVRIGYRGTTAGAISADQYYAENIRGAMAAGIETGVYFFAQAITVEEAIEEAEFVIDLLKDVEINGPVIYDWEVEDDYRVSDTELEMATACAVVFCQKIEEAGYTPMVYAGREVSYTRYDQGALAPYLYWYPEYKSDESEKLCPTFYYQMNYWQFSSSCTVDGVGGKVDANIQFIPR